jgi:hypothetical protein
MRSKREFWNQGRDGWRTPRISQAWPEKATEFLREPVGVPAGDPAAQRHTQPNKGLQATANSLRSCLAAAIGGA